MKSVCLALAAVLAIPASARAETEIDPAVLQLWDVVYTSDGNVLKGIIVEEIPGTSVRVVIIGGSSLVVSIANVVRFAKELNPQYAPVAAASPTAPSSEPAAPRTRAASGLRFGLRPGLAFHTEGEAGFLLSGHAGWEIGLDRWGLTPNITLDYTADSGVYGADGVALIPGLRAAYRGSSVSPFLGFGLGVDALNGDVSVGLTMGAGIDLIVHRRFALSAEAKFHRGFGDTYTDLLSYVAVGLGFEVRL